MFFECLTCVRLCVVLDSDQPFKSSQNNPSFLLRNTVILIPILQTRKLKFIERVRKFTYEFQTLSDANDKKT